MTNKILCVIICGILSGCGSLTPKYVRPTAPVPSMWPDHGDQVLEIADQKKRTFFRDARLRKLIETALRNNRDLRLAVLNVDLVRAQYRIGSFDKYPTIDASATALRQHDVGIGGTAAQTTERYGLKLGITSYELELSGRVRSLRARLLEYYLSTQETRRSVQISLIAQVAIQYLTERAMAEQLIQAQATFESVQAYAELIKRSYEIGNTSELDMQSAKAQAEIALAQVANFKRQRLQAENALTVLIGQSMPSDLPEPTGNQEILSNIPVGLPSDLIQHRPDILAAEHQLKAANANIGAARAAFFPRIELTGFGGLASVKLTDLVSGDKVWNFAPQITMPIFDGGANKANLDAAKISRSIEIAQYEKTIQIAFREVADALMARAPIEDQIQAQQDLVKTQQKRFDLADVRYRNGIDSYLTVLVAQQDLYTAKQALVESHLLGSTNVVLLYKALGGGWDEYALSP